MTEYFNKYLKYKFKYFNLKGGALNLTEYDKNIVKNYLQYLFKNKAYLTVENKKHKIEYELKDDIIRNINSPILLFKDLIENGQFISDNILFIKLMECNIITEDFEVIDFVKCPNEILTKEEAMEVASCLFKKKAYLERKTIDDRKRTIWDWVHSSDKDLTILKKFGYNTYDLPHYHTINEKVINQLFDILIFNNILDAAYLPINPIELSDIINKRRFHGITLTHIDKNKIKKTLWAINHELFGLKVVEKRKERIWKILHDHDKFATINPSDADNVTPEVINTLVSVLIAHEILSEDYMPKQPVLLLKENLDRIYATGIDETDKQKRKCFEKSDLVNIKNGLDEFRCLICYTIVDKSVILECGHIYCQECLNHSTMSNKPCAVCKRPYISECNVKLQNIHDLKAKIDNPLSSKTDTKQCMELDTYDNIKAGLNKILCIKCQNYKIDYVLKECGHGYCINCYDLIIADPNKKCASCIKNASEKCPLRLTGFLFEKMDPS